MNKPILIIVIFTALTGLVSWQYFMPVFDKVSGLREDLATWQGKLDETQALSKKLETLKKKYNSMPEEVERVAQAIPAKDDIPGLLVQLEQLASQNGLILNTVSFTLPETKKSKKAQQIVNEDGEAISTASGTGSTGAQKTSLPAGVKTLAVDMSLTGTQSSFKTFLLAVEENLRIMDVSSIGFSAKGSSDSTGGSSGNSGEDFKVSLNTYFRN